MSDITKEQYDALVKRCETAEAAAAEVVKKEIENLNDSVKSLTTSLATVKEDNKKLADELTASKELAKSHEDNATKLAEKIKELEAALAKAKDEMDKNAKEMCKSKRKAAMAGLDVDETRANEIVDKFANVSDEIFDEFVKAMPKKTVKTDTTTTASVKEVLDKATDKDTTVVVPTDNDTQKTLVSKASEWFLSNSLNKDKGE